MDAMDKLKIIMISAVANGVAPEETVAKVQAEIESLSPEEREQAMKEAVKTIVAETISKVRDALRSAFPNGIQATVDRFAPASESFTEDELIGLVLSYIAGQTTMLDDVKSKRPDVYQAIISEFEQMRNGLGVAWTLRLVREGEKL